MKAWPWIGSPTAALETALVGFAPCQSAATGVYCTPAPLLSPTETESLAAPPRSRGGGPPLRSSLQRKRKASRHRPAHAGTAPLLSPTEMESRATPPRRARRPRGQSMDNRVEPAVCSAKGCWNCCTGVKRSLDYDDPTGT